MHWQASLSAEYSPDNMRLRNLPVGDRPVTPPNRSEQPSGIAFSQWREAVVVTAMAEYGRK